MEGAQRMDHTLCSFQHKSHCISSHEIARRFQYVLVLVDMVVLNATASTNTLADGVYDVRYNWNGLRECKI